MVPFESFGMVSYLPSIVTVAIFFLAILEILSVKQWRDLEIWAWGRSRSLKMPRFDRPCMIDHFDTPLSMGSPFFELLDVG